MNVAAIHESEWDKHDGSPVVKVTEVTLEDGSKAPGYDLPLVPEIGKPLPDGWEFATGKSGKPYIKVPKASKNAPQAAYRNTKEGQAYEQERMDRRTALMQGVAANEQVWTTWTDNGGGASNIPSSNWQQLSEQMYEWLRKTSGAASIADRSAGASTANANVGTAGDAKSTKASRDEATPASLPASEHLAGVNGAGSQSAEGLGEGPDADEGAVVGAREGTTAAASSNSYLTKEEQRVFAAAMGGRVAATQTAVARFGDRVRGLDDLTREMATELVAARVGEQ